MVDKEMNKNKNKLFFNSNINEIFATTELIQEFQNPYEDAIELEILFPINKNINLSKFEISMKEEKIVSKIMPKEKAEEKYSDAIAKGNTGIKGQYSEDMKCYCVNIGNINPKEKITLKTIYNQPITSYDMSFEYIIMNNFPSFNFNSKNDERTKENTIEVIYNITINTCSKITRLFTNFENMKSLNITYNEDYTKSIISHKIKQDLTNKNVYENKIVEDELHILFRTKDINKPTLFYQYNPIIKKHSYSLNYLYCSDKISELIDIPEKPIENDIKSFYEKYLSNITNEEPALFIFLVDQSGSMTGEPMKVVIESMLIFIQSLPKDSFFQIIGFGSNFEKYNKSPVEYNDKNIKEIVKIIKELNADKGGTNIVSPLIDIFNNKKEYEKIKLSKNIILLTDGRVEDKNECFNLIKENCNMFKVHSIGIGNVFDEELIKSCGIYGKGSFNFVKNLSYINSVVIKILKKCIMPYLYDIKFTLLNNNKNKENKENIIFSKNEDFVYQDEIINCSFILDEDNKRNLIDLENNIIKFKIEFIKNQKPNEIEMDFRENNIICLPEGDNMTKIIVDKYLKTNINIDEQTEIKISKEYDVLSKNTSLFAEIENENSQKNKLITINVLSNVNRYVPYKFNNAISKLTCLWNYEEDLCEYGEFENDMFSSSFDCFLIPPEDDDRGSEPMISPKNSILQKKRTVGQKKGSEKEKLPRKREKSVDKGKEYKKERKKEKMTNLDINLVDLILKQSPIEGFWDKNQNTIEIEKLLDKNIINNIKKISKTNKEKEKAYYTILIIYFISTKYPEKLTEYELVLNKAKNYLKGINIIYEKIISKINK